MQASKRNWVPRRTVRSIVSLAMAGVLAGCTGFAPVYRDVAPITGPTPYVNRTPMHAALMCVRKRVAGAPDIRFGVADFVDGTGATMGDSDVNGRYFSQRPDLMLVVALSKAGVHLVNRSSTGVAEWEMKQAMDKRLGDGKPTIVGNTRFDYRPVRAGEFLGSNYYIHGAITEINWNLSSDANEVGAFGLTAGRRTYRVSMAVDLVVSNSTTTEVVFARSYSKQLVGYETGAGVFRFVNAAVVPGSAVELFQSNIGQKQNEPVQQALRWLVETAGYDIVSQIYGRDPGCDSLVPGAEPSDDRDPAIEIAPIAAQAPRPLPVPAPNTAPATRPAPAPVAELPVRSAPVPVVEQAPRPAPTPIAMQPAPQPPAPVAEQAPRPAPTPIAMQPVPQPPAPVAEQATRPPATPISATPIAVGTPRAPLEAEPAAVAKPTEWTRPQYSVGAPIQPEPGRPEDARAVLLRRDPAVQATPRPSPPAATPPPGATQVRDAAPRRPVDPAEEAPVIAPQTSVVPGLLRGPEERDQDGQQIAARPAPVALDPAAAPVTAPVAERAAAVPVADTAPAALPPQAAAEQTDLQVGRMLAASFASTTVEDSACIPGWNGLRYAILSLTTARMCPPSKPVSGQLGGNG